MGLKAIWVEQEFEAAEKQYVSEDGSSRPRGLWLCRWIDTPYAGPLSDVGSER
jgi:hypothetical protein